MGPSDIDVVLSAGELFDHEPDRSWTQGVLADPGHRLLIAFVGDEPAGFVSGVVARHPDKAPEMLLYELGVAAAYRRRGLGTALVATLRDLARAEGHRGMWVIIDPGDEIPAATYRAAGASERASSEILSWDFS